MDGNLSPRTEQILEIVLREYVAGAVPVSSKLISTRYDLGVSSATIRNEMALLEELGYLAHPYTSAGRIPTVAGYRYFVGHLMRRQELSAQEQVHIAGELERARHALDLDQCMTLAVSLLARTTGSAAWVTQPHTRRPRIRHVELVSLDSQRALLILVPYDGRVRENVLRLPQRVRPRELEALARRLSHELEGQDHVEPGPGQDPTERLVLEEAQRMLEAMQAEEPPAVYRDGLSHVLSQPEFTAVEQARQVLELWEGDEILNFVLTRPRGRRVQVIIAGEDRWDLIQDYSLVFTDYGSRGRASGLLGVMGPLRMPYGKAVSAVGFVGHLLSQKMREIYGA